MKSVNRIGRALRLKLRTQRFQVRYVGRHGHEEVGSVGKALRQTLGDDLPHARHRLGTLGDNLLDVRHGGLAAILFRPQAEEVDSLARRQFFRRRSDPQAAVTLLFEMLPHVFLDDSATRPGTGDRRRIDGRVLCQLRRAGADSEEGRPGVNGGCFFELRLRGSVTPHPPFGLPLPGEGAASGPVACLFF